MKIRSVGADLCDRQTDMSRLIQALATDLQKKLKCDTNTGQVFFIVVPCMITLKFLLPTNAPLYYTHKMLKYTARSSPDCSYMFRSTWNIIREPMPNLAKVTILWK